MSASSVTRARASVPAAPAPPPVAPRPAGGREERRVRQGASLARYLVVELVVVAIALAALAGAAVAVAAVGAAGALLVLLTFLRVRDRWWTEAIAERRRWRARRAAGSAVPRVVRAHDDRGTVVGVACDQGGWYAAVAVLRSGVTDRPAGPLPIGALADLLASGAVPVSVFQVTTMTIPTPHAVLSQTSPAAASYLELCRDLAGGAPPPAAQSTWIAVRLSVPDAIGATHSRGGGTTGVHRAIATTVGRVATALAAAGLEHSVLGPQELADAVRRCSGVPAGAESGRTFTEEWRSWAADGVVDVGFEVTRWPAGEPGAALADLSTVRAARVVCSLELRPAPPRHAGAGRPAPVLLRATVRVAAVPAQLPDAVAGLTARAADVGVKLRRLDGWHAPACYASAPTGGGPG
jgi:type VII secretion protein EccE